MKLTDLPPEQQQHIEALLEIVGAECAHRSWDDIEPVLALYWQDTHRAGAPSWEEVRPYVRTACEPGE